MTVKLINPDNRIGDPEFIAIAAATRNGERAHLLKLLRILMSELKKNNATATEIYATVELWIFHREKTISEEITCEQYND